jgi:CRP-like cAMP-binding protein
VPGFFHRTDDLCRVGDSLNFPASLPCSCAVWRRSIQFQHRPADRHTLENRILASLPGADYALVAPYLTQLNLERGRLLYEPGDEIEYVYFPHDGVISLLTLMENGSAIEWATVGREGAVGFMAASAPRQSLSRAVTQTPCRVARINVSPLHLAWTTSSELRSLVERHSEALFGHAIQSAACNALHSVEARFCRWLLTCRDRISSDTLALTQEFLADMLGVQRTTITVVARALQAKGLIRYRRGVVDLLDRAGLEAASCECHGVVRRTYERLLPGSNFD